MIYKYKMKGKKSDSVSVRSSTKSTKSLFKTINGRLDLSCSNLQDLRSIGVLPDLEILIISDNEIRSFSGLKPQPRLKTIIANRNPIKCLSGLSEQKALENLEISGSPIENDPQFRPRVLATIGSHLLTLNGIQLTQQEQMVSEVILKRSPEKCYILSEETFDGEEDSEEEDQMENFMEMLSIYNEEHQSLYTSFGLNEAKLYDLKLNGGMPVVQSLSSNEEIAQAIVNLNNRIRSLKESIEDFSGQE